MKREGNKRERTKKNNKRKYKKDNKGRVDGFKKR